MTGTELFADVDRFIGAAPPADLPTAIGRLVELEERARLRLRIESSPNGNEHGPTAEPDRRLLLTYPEVAELLRSSSSYVETLVRQGKLPTVTLPGTDKGTGEHRRERRGRQKRVLLSEVHALLSKEPRA